MSLRIAHLADAHLGFRQYGFIERERDFYRAAQQAFQKAIENRAQVIILAGDTFDDTKPPAMAVWVMQQLVLMANQAKIRVLGIDGNHDSCNGHWLKICGVEVLTPDHPITVNGVTIVGVPATRPVEFERQLDRLVQNGTRVDCLVIHQAVAELCDFGTDITAMSIARKVAQIGVKYVAMGDIHGYKETVIGGVRFCYPGSADITALDQARDKSISLVDFNGTQVQTTMIPLHTRRFRDYQLRTDSDLNQLTEDSNLEADQQPLLILRYEPEQRELAKRAEALLKTSSLMYRLYALSGTTELRQQISRQGFERKGALLQLRQAVEAFFQAGTDEYQLVFGLLDTPDRVKDIVEQYLKTKGNV
jgi:DNA repair exonuclease SbcCD nuclease subunit